jgi:GNAT superfamily N-acetyltransferase
VRVRPRTPADEPAVRGFLEERGSDRVARLGELVEPLDHPALLAEESGRLIGVLTYIVGGRRCEVLTLHASRRQRGTGTVLLDAVVPIARDSGCSRLFVITTNDNLDALRFYQRRGFRLGALHAGAVDESRRRLKPEIPALGEHGIAIRDEIELERPIA